MKLSKKSVFIYSICATALLHFSFVKDNEVKKEFVNIQIDHENYGHRVEIYTTSGHFEKTAYILSNTRRSQKKFLEKRGYKFQVSDSRKGNNVISMNLLKEYNEQGWKLLSHSKTASEYSDESSYGSSESTNLVFER